MHYLSQTKNNRQKSSKESLFWGEKRTNKLQDCYILAKAHLPICKASYPSWSSLLSCSFAVHLQPERTGASKYIHIFISNSPAFASSKALRPALPQAALLKHLLTDWGPHSYWTEQLMGQAVSASESKAVNQCICSWGEQCSATPPKYGRHIN